MADESAPTPVEQAIEALENYIERTEATPTNPPPATDAALSDALQAYYDSHRVYIPWTVNGQATVEEKLCECACCVLARPLLYQAPVEAQ